MLRAVRRASGLAASKMTVPDPPKTTLVERLSIYWKSLYADYKSMVVDLKVEMQEKPKKTLIILSSLAAAAQLARHNPDDIDFKEDLRKYCNQIALVGDSCRNPKTVQHFKTIEKYCNEDILIRSSLGIASIMWISDYNDNCDLYKARCDYIRPGFFSVPFRIVDIGIMGKWWNVYRLYQNFDVNH